MSDLITERADKCLCPICNEDIGTEFKLVEYKRKTGIFPPYQHSVSRKVWVHKRHYVEGE